MSQQSIKKTKWLGLPLVLIGVVGLGCNNKDKVAQPYASVPNSTASTSTPASNTPTASTTTATDSSMAASNTIGKTELGVSATPSSATPSSTSASSTSATQSTSTPATSGKTAVTAANLNDMQIVDAVKAVNDAEIGSGTLAKTRAENPGVRAYAKKMIDEHSKNSSQEKAIMAKNSNHAATEYEGAKAMRAETSEKLSKLQNMSGSAFDQAYIDEQVKMHKQLLSDLDNNYIPAAKDAKLKDYLKETRKHVTQHLEGAQQVLTMINSGL